MGEVEVCRGSSDDATDVAEVKRRSWQTAYRGVLPDSFLDTREPFPTPAQWRAAMRHDDGPDVLVARETGAAVGMAASTRARDDDFAWRSHVADEQRSEPDRRGRRRPELRGEVLVRAT